MEERESAREFAKLTLLKKEEHNDKDRKLKPYHCCAVYLQGNVHITEGYRGELSWTQCLKSLFQRHNETLNVWTHLFGFLLFVGLMIDTLAFRLDSPSMMDVVAFVVYFIAVQAQMLFSALFHLFCCHSFKVYYWFAKLDYAGITIMITGSYFSILYYSWACYPTIRTIYLSIVLVLGIISMIVSMVPAFAHAKLFKIRAAFFLMFGGYGLIPLPHLIYLEGFSTLWPLLWRILILGGLYVVGVGFYSSQFPESKFPGKFNYGLSSHVIWHMFVLSAGLMVYFSCLYAYRFRKYDFPCPPD